MARLTEDTFSRGLETARLLLTSPRFSTTLAAAIRRHGGVDRAIGALLKEFELETSETPSQQTAREIMGVDFHGIPEVERFFGEMTDSQRKQAEVIPEKIMADVRAMTPEERSKYILEYDTGISLLDVRAKARKGLFYKQDWLKGEEFAKRTETARWRLIRKTPVDGSFSKNWIQQERLIDSQIDEIPSTRQVVYTMILHFLATGERLFETCYVRTCDVDSNGLRVDVGGFDGVGLRVRIWLDSGPVGFLGLSAARKVS